MFVALDLPDEARAEVAAWRDQLTPAGATCAGCGGEALHVTMVFLGWQDESAAEAISAAAVGAAGRIAAPVLRAGEVRALPPRNPRLFALDFTTRQGEPRAERRALGGVGGGALVST